MWRVFGVDDKSLTNNFEGFFCKSTDVTVHYNKPVHENVPELGVG